MPVAVDIVLPCYNPGNKWPEELHAFWREAKDHYNLRFIVVNDGSSPGKVEEVLNSDFLKNIPLVYTHYSQNKGKGFALRHGVRQANANFIIYTDIDFPFTNQSMLNVMDALVTHNYDVVAGFRNQDYYLKKMSGFRVLLSKAFRFFISKGLAMPITDTQCGLKGFNTAGKETFLQTTINRYLFDFEFIYQACRSKSLTVVPVAVELKENVQFSKMRFKIVLQELFNLLKVLVSKAP